MGISLTNAQIGEQIQSLSLQDLILPVLVQLLVIILVAPLFAAIARRLKQPSAVGWITAGIILGPSFLGKYFPTISQWIFHLEVVGYAPAVGHFVLPAIFFILAEIGLVLLLFTTGVEFNFGHLRHKGTATIVISIAGIFIPFALAMSIAPILHQATAPTVSSLSFALFLGTCMSITALPILGLLMQELGISQTRLGAVTISAAASDDAVGWMLLALVAAIVKSQFDLLRFFIMIGAAAIFLMLMLTVCKPILLRLLSHHLDKNRGELSSGALALLLAFVMLCGIMTHLIGIFALFGAFLAGAILADVPGLREAVKKKLQDIITIMFLPIFFTYTGLHTNIAAFDASLWALFFLILMAAIIGKLGGCALAARLCGFSTRESLCIGAMMNCRALMELIAINVGHRLGVIPDSVYSMLVIMALVTTVMTTPLLFYFKKGTELEEPLQNSGFGDSRKRDSLVF